VTRFGEPPGEHFISGSIHRGLRAESIYPLIRANTIEEQANQMSDARFPAALVPLSLDGL
jgi:hypothetical protein